jgi:dihydrolipoamide dehydrogenase
MADVVKAYDVVVIGSGPGGYVCAIRCAQLGLKTAVVEYWPALGGTCLNVGCIPSKAILESSELFHKAKGEFKKHGIVVDPVLDLATMHERKQKIVEGLTRGVAGLFKKHSIDRFEGRGVFRSALEIVVEPRSDADGGGGGEAGLVLRGEAVVIATGSKVKDLPGVIRDDDRILGSAQALDLPEVPEHLAVIGAGVIGLELGSVWRRLGAKVTVLEYMDRVFPTADKAVSKAVRRSFRRLKIDFKLGVAVQRAEADASGVTVVYDDKGTEKSLRCDRLLVAVGRRPNTDGLGCEAMGIELDRGQVVIDDHFQTAARGVYAIGDVVRGPMLAHKAEDEGVAVAEIIAGKPGHVNYDVIPSVIYTHPEVAWVGRTEEQLKEDGTPYVVGTFPFLANGRARALEATDGMVKMLAHAETDRILGVHIVGPMAGELIGEIGVAMEFGASAEDIARTCHAHPTLSEVVKEAALDVGGRVIHI